MKSSFVALVSLATVGFGGTVANAQTIPSSGLNLSGPVSVAAPQVNAPDIPVGAVQVQPGAVQVKDNNLSIVNAPNFGDAAQLQTKSVAFPGFSSSRPVAEIRGGLSPSCAAAPISSSQIWGICSVTAKLEFVAPVGGGLSKTEKRARAVALFQQELQAAKLLAEVDETMKEKSLKMISDAVSRYETALAKYR
jgi:hypothetical protein